MKAIVKILVLLFFTISAIFLIKTLFLPGYSDFAVYYYSSQMILKGQSPYLGGINIFTPITYPPFSFIFFLFLSIFPFMLSARIFTFISLAFLFLSLFFIFKIGKMKAFSYLFFLVSGLSFVYFPVKFTLGMGQVNLIVLFLIVMFIYFIVSRSQFLPAIFLGAAFLIKMYPILLFPYLLLKRKYKILLFCSFFIFLGICLSLFVVPSGIYNYYFNKIFPSLLNSWPSDYYNQAISGVLSRSFADSVLRTYLRYIFIVFITLSSFLIIAKSKIKNLQMEVGYLITVNLLVNAFSWQHHFVWLIIPLIFTLFYLIKNKAKTIYFVILFLCYLLTAVNLSNPQNLPTIFLSHVFFGTFLLWLFNSFLFLKSSGVYLRRFPKI